MGVLDIFKRIGGGLESGLNTLGGIQQDQQNLRQFGPHYRQIIANQELENRLEQRRSVAATRTAEANADSNERNNRIDKLRDEAEESYQSAIGRASYLSDVDSFEATKDDAFKQGIRATLEQDELSDRLQHRSDTATQNLNVLEKESDIASFPEDQAREQRNNAVSDESGQIRLEEARRQNLLGREYDAADREASLERAQGVRTHPGKRDISKAEEGFLNASNLLSSSIEEATMPLIEGLSTTAADQKAALMQMTANGVLMLVDAKQQPLTIQGLDAIIELADDSDLKSAYEELGYTLAQGTGNSSIALLQEIQAPADNAFNVMQKEQATKSLQQFDRRYPTVLPAATAGDPMSDDQVAAFEIILREMDRLLGKDKELRLPEIQAAIDGILTRKEVTPNGQIK